MSGKVFNRLLSPLPAYLNPMRKESFKNYMMKVKMSSAAPTQDYATITDLKATIAREMGVDTGYQPIPKDRSHLLKYLPQTQEELPTRSMQDSFLAGIIPLSTDKVLQDKYITFLGHVRTGRLLEDMDIFAVMVAHKHIVNPKAPKNEDFPYTLVTALVDKIDFSEFTPKPQEDIKISGHVSWVGKSSLEVVVWLEQQMHNTWHRITRALFLLAARDSNNMKAAIVNAIDPANDREREILSGGEDRKKRRIKIQQAHVSKVVPNSEEQKVIHDLYLRTANKDISLRTRVLPSGCAWMSAAHISNVVFSHPSDRNMHNTVFGGFIMRQAEELSWVLGHMFSKYRPILKSISDISFQRPIAVSSLIQMHAYVVYTQMNYMQIAVFVETFNPITGKNDTTNTFQFTFVVPEVVNEIVPNTYHEAMMYIDGRRHFQDVMKKSIDTGKIVSDGSTGDSYTSDLGT
ncbi:unnamed protein product [Phaedon cochleariae]|uniref:HotDog ACOT-type domain-containing protein n=1 Tax=Phaedon cochleariae TaxID=80249 RepID=A0A9N9X4Q4_PHACE|nr:unnamed protein product [Phaedon cochleariae]